MNMSDRPFRCPGGWNPGAIGWDFARQHRRVAIVTVYTSGCIICGSMMPRAPIRP